MSKPSKIVLGIATLWPFVYMVIFMAFWFYMLTWISSHPQGGDGIPAGFVAIFVLHGITILVMLALLAVYIIDVFRNDRVEKDKKALWAVVLFLGNIIAMPIYWYLYVWPNNDRLSASMR